MAICKECGNVFVPMKDGASLFMCGKCWAKKIAKGDWMPSVKMVKDEKEE